MSSWLQAIGGIGVFLLGMVIMTEGLKSLAGAQLSQWLASATRSPASGAVTGAISTAILQSSSATTVAAVGFVGVGIITFQEGLGIILGANIGTTVTNTIVSILHVTRRQEFERAFAASIVHDLFNILAVIILFPIEMTTHILEKTATVLSNI